MRRRLVRGIVVIAAIISALFLNDLMKTRREKKLAAETETALRYYSQTLKPGLTRKEVEDYLQGNNTSFSEACCYEGGVTFATLVKVGEADKPWYCSEFPIYVVFEFTSVWPPPRPVQSSKEDILRRVHLTSRGEGCL